jgi:hypothetical protein
MAMKILVVKQPGFDLSPEAWKGAEPAELEKIPAILKSDIPPGGRSLLLAPAALRKAPQIAGLLDAGLPITCLFFQSGAEANQFGPVLTFLASEDRSTGVKNCLAKGSTVYSETFFQAGKVGERLDPVFRFAREKLGARRALEAWSTLQSFLFLGIRALPEQGEKGTGERVDVQLGADGNRLAFSIRFDLPPEETIGMRRHSLMELARDAVDFFEFRYLQSAGKAEFLGLCFLSTEAATSIEAQSFHPEAALESAQSVKDYVFETFGALHGSAGEEKRVLKGGFKKKFSERVKSVSQAEEVTPAAPQVTEEKIIDADAGNFLVSGEVLQPNQTVVVSGSAGKEKPKEQPAAAAEASAGKSQSLLESKLEGLESTLKQREELIAKLNKEIEEIKDPMKKGVISGIKDSQLEGMKQNLARMEKDLAESNKREKELMAVVDKAIQMKDEAVRKFKELDVKLRQSSGGTNSKVVTLEKQLEEQKRQNKELSKRVTALTEQLTAAGKRVA